MKLDWNVSAGHPFFRSGYCLLQAVFCTSCNIFWNTAMFIDSWGMAPKVVEEKAVICLNHSKEEGQTGRQQDGIGWDRMEWGCMVLLSPAPLPVSDASQSGKSCHTCHPSLSQLWTPICRTGLGAVANSTAHSFIQTLMESHQKYAPTDICTKPSHRRHKHMQAVLYMLKAFYGIQEDSTEREGALTDLKKTLEPLIPTRYVFPNEPPI